ncbi:MAG: hypothetical protein V4543_02455 [Bacteroidota bacterium]
MKKTIRPPENRQDNQNLPCYVKLLLIFLLNLFATVSLPLAATDPLAGAGILFKNTLTMAERLGLCFTVT